MKKQITMRPEDNKENVYKDRNHKMVFKRKFYEQELYKLEIELLKLQKWVITNNKRILIIMEGRDGAGKGGTIKALTEKLNPRGFRIVALQKPTDSEKKDWYFKRYISELPKPGEIVLFDRSWYNRAGVERVMGFCTQEEYKEFIYQVLNLEQMLITSGLHIFKYFLNVSRNEQKRRIERRKTDPLRMWKLSSIDNKSLNLWDEYTDAFQKMFSRTHNAESPWIMVDSTDKKRARINIARDLLSKIDYDGKDQSKVCLLADPNIVSQYSQANFIKNNDKKKQDLKNKTQNK
ncbi:polyphosphate kinase 2 [Helicobacter sp. MIT 99-5507]|uniref:polyphosphate kinase 2 n=1 Tax=Helicobacter sp. MIT 99-5507 TaxID=152489 RepID=UPI000E1EC5EA|nr:polyphosphate kinase 2 [Helicobacter sp. MIT 99-5507]RDU57431.1 polyphosphate kinase 2 [Helicobacter sp. MIT 99-5507]